MENNLFEDMPVDYAPTPLIDYGVGILIGLFGMFLLLAGKLTKIPVL